MNPQLSVKQISTNSGSFLPCPQNSHSSFLPVQEVKKDSLLSYLDTRSTSQQKDVHKKPTSYSDQLKIKHQTKQRITDLLLSIGKKELADRMSLCSESFAAITCGRHLVAKVPMSSCNIRYCPFCAVKRQRKLKQKYLPLMRKFMRSSYKLTPQHLTLTQVHRVETLVESRKRLMDSFLKVQRRKFWQKYIAGGLYAFEVTIGTDGLWHAHLHILVFRRVYINVSRLRTEWLKVSPGSVNFKLKQITDLEAGLTEVVKYLAKPMDFHKFGSSEMREFLKLKGQRVCGAFGEFAKFCRVCPDAEPGEVEFTSFCEGDACPICDEPLFEVRMTTAELIQYSRQVEKVALHTKYLHLEI